MISLDEVSFTFEIPEDVLEKSTDPDALLEEIGTFLKESILDNVGSGRSPVAGVGSFQKLSTAYADAQKMGDTNPNLELAGDMLNALEYRIEGNTVVVGIFDETQTPKAYNHNVGDTLPKRQFIPDEDQLLKADIIRGVNRIIEEYMNGEEE
jgi:hypothetical protein